MSGTWEAMTPIARGNVFLAADRVTRALDELKANRSRRKRLRRPAQDRALGGAGR